MEKPVLFSFFSQSSFETDGSNFSRCSDEESLSNDPNIPNLDESRNTGEIESVSQNLSAGQNKSQLCPTEDLRQNETLKETLFCDCELMSESIHETENNAHSIQDKSSFSLFSDKENQCDLGQNENIFGESFENGIDGVAVIDLNYGRNDTMLKKKKGRPKKNGSKFRIEDVNNPKPQRSDDQRTKIVVDILNSVVTVSTEVVKKYSNFGQKFLFKKISVDIKKEYKKAKEISEFRRVTIRKILQENVDMEFFRHKKERNFSKKEIEEALQYNINIYDKITKKKISEIEAFFDLNVEEFVREYYCKLNELCPYFKENKTFYDVLLVKNKTESESLKNLIKLYFNLA